MPKRCDNCKITKSRSDFIKGRAVCKTCTNTTMSIGDIRSITDDDISVTNSSIRSTKSDERVLENVMHLLGSLSAKMDTLETLSTKMDTLSSRVSALEALATRMESTSQEFANINVRLDGITDKLQSCGTWTESIHESVNQVRIDAKHSQLQTDRVYETINNMNTTVVAVINSKLDDTSCSVL